VECGLNCSIESAAGRRGADTSPRLLSSVEMFDGAESDAGENGGASEHFGLHCYTAVSSGAAEFPSPKPAPSFKFSSSRGRRVKVELVLLVPVVSTLGHSPSTRLGVVASVGVLLWDSQTAQAQWHLLRHDSRQGQRLMMRGLEEGQTGGPDKYRAKPYVWRTAANAGQIEGLRSSRRSEAKQSEAKQYSDFRCSNGASVDSSCSLAPKSLAI
jgi:hypothetical protein